MTEREKIHTAVSLVLIASCNYVVITIHVVSTAVTLCLNITFILIPIVVKVRSTQKVLHIVINLVLAAAWLQRENVLSSKRSQPLTKYADRQRNVI